MDLINNKLYIIIIITLSPFYLFGQKTSSDTLTIQGNTTMVLSELVKINSSFRAKKINKTDTLPDSEILKVNKLTETKIELIFGDSIFLGTKNIENNLIYRLNPGSDLAFGNWIKENFPNLKIGTHKKGGNIIISRINQHYEKFFKSKNGWSTLKLLENINAKNIDPQQINLIQKETLENALFNTLIFAITKNSENDVTIKKERLAFYMKKSNFLNREIKLTPAQLTNEIKLPVFVSNKNNTRPLWITIGILSMLLLTSFLTIGYFLKTLIVPYRNYIKNDLSSKLKADATAENISIDNPQQFMDFLQRRTSKIPMKFQIFVTNINTIHKDNLHSCLAPLKEILIDFLKLEHSFINKVNLGLLPAPTAPPDDLKELLKKTKSIDRIKKAVAYIDKTYSFENLSPEVNKLYKESDVLKNLSNYSKSNPIELESKLKLLSNKDNPSVTDLFSFMEVFKLAYFPKLIGSLKDNARKVKIFDSAISRLATDSNDNTALNLIQKTDTALSILKELDVSNKVNFANSCIKQLERMYVIDKMLDSKPHDMEKAGEDATKEINRVLKTQLMLPEKEKISKAFMSAKLAEETDFWLSNFHKRYSSFYADIAGMNLDKDDNMGWVTEQLIEMALMGLDFSCQGKRGFANSRANYLVLLHDGFSKITTEFIERKIDTQHSKYFDEYHVINLVKYAQKLKVKSLKNVLIDGFLISDEVLQTKTGSIIKYSKS